MKQCTKCLGFFELDGFHKDKRSKDGHLSYCKKCNKARVREWVINNPEKAKYQHIKAKLKPGYSEKVAEKCKKYRSSYKGMETSKKYRADYYEKNKHKISERVNEWWSNNYEKKMHVYSKRYYEKNKDDLVLKACIVSKIKTIELEDSYIKKVVSKSTGIPIGSITPEMVEAKRIHIQLTRFIKENLK